MNKVKITTEMINCMGWRADGEVMLTFAAN